MTDPNAPVDELPEFFAEFEQFKESFAQMGLSNTPRQYPQDWISNESPQDHPEYANDPAYTTSAPSTGSNSTATTDMRSTFSSNPNPRGDADSVTSVGSARSRFPTVQDQILAQPQTAAMPILPCEFAGVMHCNAMFEADDERGWIEHIEDHLEGHFPKESTCWFCDVWPFKASFFGGDKQVAFCQRLRHVRAHFIDEGMTVDHMRPDFPMVYHLNDHGLISQQMFLCCLGYTETPAEYAYREEEEEDDDDGGWGSGPVVAEVSSSKDREHRKKGKTATKEKNTSSSKPHGHHHHHQHHKHSSSRKK